ncbi:MAG: hypothetical protein U1B79_01110, partial [Candidatus Pacearchaeota archaeon]|nr:hypothetical protein [Candidatus Pacearchaeota archaeon]
MTVEKLKENFERQRKIAEEISALSEELRGSKNEEEREMISSQIESLRNSLRKSGKEVVDETERISIPKPLSAEQPSYNFQMQPSNRFVPMKEEKKKKEKEEKVSGLEKLTL